MRSARWTVPLVVMAVGAAAAFAYPARAQEPPVGMRVRGEGLVTAPPDLATLTLGPSVRRESPSEAFSRAEELAAALTRTLQSNGVAPADIQTTTVSLFQEFGPPPPGGQQPVPGWRASRIFSVKLRDFARISGILEQAAALLGADAQIQGISFGIEDTDVLIARARAEAFANAREAAAELARLAGAQLGEVISMEETFTPSPTPVQAGPSPTPRPAPLPTPAPARPEAPVSQVPPGTVSVRVFVTAVFALERPPRA